MRKIWSDLIPFTVLMTVLLLIPRPAAAEPITFSFEDPKGVNSMNIALYSELEPIMGTAKGVSGSVTFDPENPEAITGNVVVQADQILMANERMTKMLHAEEWLHVAERPTAEFTVKEVISSEKTGDNQYELGIRGDFSLNGVTKELVAPVILNYQPGKLNARNGKGEGDLLVVRSNFAFDRRHFEIQPERGPEKVAYMINIEAGIVGFAPKE